MRRAASARGGERRPRGHLAGVRTLHVHGCNQDTITDAALTHLAGVQWLNVSTDGPFTSAALAQLAGAHVSHDWW